MNKYFKSVAVIIISVLILTFSDVALIEAPEQVEISEVSIVYTFRSEEQYESHFEKHGDEFGDISQDEYLKMANALIQDESGEVLMKLEAEDNDYVYYKESTNEFLILSPDGYIRTYFRPDDGIEYYNRQ